MTTFTGIDQRNMSVGSMSDIESISTKGFGSIYITIKIELL